MKNIRQSGFALIEFIIVILVIAIIGVLAFPQMFASKRPFHFAGVQKQLVTSLREARQEAVLQRAAINFRYDDVNKQIIISGGTLGRLGDANNRVVSIVGEDLQANDIVYGRAPGSADSALDDGVSMTKLTGDVIDLTFQTDGSLMDAKNNPQNAAIFFYYSQAPGDTAFAVSVLGSSGRTKLWQYIQGANLYIESPALDTGK